MIQGSWLENLIMGSIYESMESFHKAIVSSFKETKKATFIKAMNLIGRLYMREWTTKARQYFMIMMWI